MSAKALCSMMQIAQCFLTESRCKHHDPAEPGFFCASDEFVRDHERAEIRDNRTTLLIALFLVPPSNVVWTVRMFDPPSVFATLSSLSA